MDNTFEDSARFKRIQEGAVVQPDDRFWLFESFSGAVVDYVDEQDLTLEGNTSQFFDVDKKYTFTRLGVSVFDVSSASYASGFTLIRTSTPFNARWDTSVVAGLDSNGVDTQSHEITSWDDSTWSIRTSVPAKTAKGCAVGLRRGHCFSGMNGAGAESHLRWEHCIYDPLSWTWKIRGKRPFGAYGSSAYKTSPYGGLGFGGAWTDGRTDVNYQWNTAAETWTSKAAGPEEKDYCSSFAIGRYGYVAGGSTAGDAFRNVCHLYDYSVDSWTQKSNLNTGRYAATGSQAWRLGHIARGQKSGGYALSMEQYDPDDDVWSEDASWISGDDYTAGSFAYDVFGLAGGQYEIYGAYKYTVSTDTLAAFTTCLQPHYQGMGMAIDRNGSGGTFYKREYITKKVLLEGLGTVTKPLDSDRIGAITPSQVSFKAEPIFSVPTILQGTVASVVGNTIAVSNLTLTPDDAVGFFLQMLRRDLRFAIVANSTDELSVFSLKGIPGALGVEAGDTFQIKKSYSYLVQVEVGLRGF